MTRSVVLATLSLALGLTVLVAAPGEALSKKQELYSAWVPSLCGHPSGRLVDGRLPGIPPGAGEVYIPKRSLVKLGRLTKGKNFWGAMVVRCNQGGVPWPDNIVVYRPDGAYVGVRRLGNITKGGREGVRNIRISKRAVRVQVVGINQGDEPSCCGTESALLKFGWNKHKQRIVTTDKHLFTERIALRKLLKAVNHGHRKRARHHATKPVVKTLFWIRRQGWGPLHPGRCFGVFDDMGQDSLDLNQRGCEVRDRWGRTGLKMTRSSWKSFRAKSIIYGHD